MTGDHEHTHPAEQRFLEAVQQVGMGLLGALETATTAADVDYYLFYGSLLGAVRTGDWIPWDDDVDVAMFRADYERFRLVADNHLPPGYRFSDARLDPAHVTSIPRILDLNTERPASSRTRKTLAPERVHVALDIFILDEAPTDPRQHARWRKRIRLLEKLVVATGTSARGILAGPGSPIKKAAELGGIGFARLASSRSWRDRYVRACRAYEGKGSGVFSLTNGWTLKTRERAFPLADIRPAKPICFRDAKVPGPADPHEVLTRIYGDYMTPPPESARHPVHFRSGLIVRHDDGTVDEIYPD